MPLNGGGTASKPAGTTAVPNTTIASTPFNSVIDDIYAIFNTPRPIVYGGTNGASAVEGGDNLSTKGADIPSATTTDIGASTGRFVHITGTTTITGLGTKTAGVVRFVVFDGILTLTHNATSLILPGAANITTAAGDGAVFVSEGAGNWRCIDYIRASGLPVVNTAAGLQGYVFGLTATTNSGSPSNNIDISAGVAAKFDSPYTLMTLASAITKNTANAWAVGNNNGSLDTGAIANSTYYGYLIQRSDTGVVDVLTSLSSTAPTMPANYDRRSPALFTFTRTAGVNGAVSPYRVGAVVVTPWVAYTPTFTGFGTPTNVSIYSRRIGANLEIEGYFTCGTSTAVTAAVSLGFNGVNGGLTIDSFLANTRMVGFAGSTIIAGTPVIVAPLAAAGGTALNFSGYVAVAGGGRSNLTTVTGNSILASGDSLSFKASVPIQGWNV